MNDKETLEKIKKLEAKIDKLQKSLTRVEKK